MSTQYLLAHLFAILMALAGVWLLHVASEPQASNYTRNAGYTGGLIFLSLGAFLLGQLHGPF